MDTFTVRVGPTGAESEGTGVMRGEVRHVRSGTASRFVGEGELLEFIVEMVNRPLPRRRERPPIAAHGSLTRGPSPMSLQEWLSYGSKD